MNGSTIDIGVKSIELLVAVRFRKKNSKILQIFTIEGTKTAVKAAFDKRYDIHDMFLDKVEKQLLSNRSNDFAIVSLEESFEEHNRTYEFNYIKDGEPNKEMLSNYFFIVPSFLPPEPGCKYCIYSHLDNDFYYCSLKDKTFAQPLKKCIIFKQKKMFKT